ncbi:unnamed protein product [Paramecium octaurelia]|uniref:Uncharacterized protein n=1 Tax=Paramecium octaurelia TaxID=43137 RepID=A0A8S1WB49_PAROT|nr:unnamed protein product [Paramecium octaurelia]
MVMLMKWNAIHQNNKTVCGIKKYVNKDNVIMLQFILLIKIVRDMGIVWGNQMEDVDSHLIQVRKYCRNSFVN